MEVKLKEFKVYAPPDCKSHDLNDDGTLTITGIASTTNEDLDGEIVTPNALKSLAEQVIGLNLHLDHNHHYDGGIGVVTDAKLESNSLRITAVILSEYAKGIKERLDLGMNFGFSIGGIPIIDRSDSRKINDFKLLEMSLTLLPANWDTFGTVETKGIVKSKCLTGACHYILKNSDTMEKKDANNQELVVNDDVKQMFIDIVNEAIYNLKPQLIEDLRGDIINDIRGELSTIVQDVVTPLLDASEPEVEDEKDVEEVIDEESIEEPVDEEAPAESEEESEDEEEVVEEKDAEETITEESLDDCTDKEASVDEASEDVPEEEPEEEVVEEEKDLEEPPVLEQPAAEQPAAAPKVIVDIKELGAEISKHISKAMSEKSFRDEMVEDIKSDIYKSLDAKRKEKKVSSTDSKFKQYSEETKTKSVDEDGFLDTPKRDRFGRNRKFLSRN